MNPERLHELIRLLKEEGLTEITICEGEDRITVRQAAAGPVAATPVAPSAIVSEPDDLAFTLDAPLVGTYYSRPNPDSEPFVVVGDIVKPGDVVGIIEAMKVMNEIRAEEAGRLRRALVEDGTPVEYGQELLVFERL